MRAVIHAICLSIIHLLIGIDHILEVPRVWFKTIYTHIELNDIKISTVKVAFSIKHIVEDMRFVGQPIRLRSIVLM